jgi:hypothetical protein
VLADRCDRPDLTAVLAGRILEQPPGLRAQLGSKGAADLAALVESVSARGCPPPTGAADERVRAALDDLRTALSGLQARSVS